jgi:hypothetical protein
VAKRTKGINPHHWFYGLQRELRNNDNAYTVLAGSACEQWLNGEFFRYLSTKLPPSFYPYPEAGKRDVVVFHQSTHEAAAVVETKLVYLNYSKTRIANYFDVLGWQMQKALNRLPNAEVIGLALAAYAYWGDRRRKPSLKQFREDVVLPALLKAARSHRAVMAKPTVETLLKLRDNVRVGGARATVALVGQYLRFPKK